MSRFRALAAGFVIVLVVGIVLGGIGDERSPFTETAAAASLTPFGDCDDLLSWFQETALEQVGPYGLDGGLVAAMGGADIAVEEDSAAGAPEGAPAPQMQAPAMDGTAERTLAAEADQGADAAGGEDFSGTNVQEAGVDEPDITKTDGRRLVTLVGGQLRILDVTGDEPQLLSSTALDGMWGQELLLDGDRVLVLGHADTPIGLPRPVDPGIGGGVSGEPGAAGDVEDLPADVPVEEPATDLAVPDIGRSMPMFSQVSVLRMLDIADPANPRVTSSLSLDGGYVSARMVDGIARVVLRSEPTGLAFSYPEGGGIRAERDATERNREVIRASTVEDWLPYMVAEADGRTTEGVLLDCDRVHRPSDPAGLGVLSVLSVPLADELAPGDGAGVVAQGETVYASRDNLYVAWSRWDGVVMPFDVEVPAGEADRSSSEVHQFDISDPERASYVASGSFEGRLLNQFSLSEHDGHLRVATTRGNSFGPRGGPGDSSSSVIVLRAEGEELTEVGRVDGLGPGERIYAVRFLGDIGYVVTFRETDPLYTVDLSDPVAPRVRGELKIPGFSAYLHPLSDGLLLGVGQDVDEGSGQRLGTQLSLFDVSDLDNPRRIQQLTLPEHSSAVEYDHRAFLHWPTTGLIAVPAERYGWSDDGELRAEDVFSGIVGLTVDEAAGFDEVGRISHAEVTDTGEGTARPDPYGWTPPIQRSIVVGDRLLTVSEVGVGSNDLTTLGDGTLVRF